MSRKWFVDFFFLKKRFTFFVWERVIYGQKVFIIRHEPQKQKRQIKEEARLMIDSYNHN